MLKDLDAQYVLPTYARQDISFVKGENATLTDSEGKEYIDFMAGIAVVSIGHSNEKLSSADAFCRRLRAWVDGLGASRRLSNCRDHDKGIMSRARDW